MDMGWGVVQTTSYPMTLFMTLMTFEGDVETTKVTTIPADAIITEATATITVKEAGVIAAGKVAQVRNGENSTVVVLDFGALRTVSSLSLPSGKTLVSLRRWAGTGFTSVYLTAAQLAGSSISFAEVQSERLELTFSTAVAAAVASTALDVTMPGVPTDLSLEIAGVRAWSRPGPVKLSSAATPEATFTVPVIAELQAALARGANPAVTLRTGTPCSQGLSLSIGYIRVHAVALPPAGLVVGGESEAEVEASLPLPAASSTWEVVRIELTVAGRMPAWRAWPLPDPLVNGAARLVIDPAHSYAARLPASWLAPLGELLAIRLPLVLPPGFLGAELAAVLHQGTLDLPIAPVPSARFKPTPIAADPVGGERWVELQLAKPVKIPPGATWWVEITATRGACDWPMSQVTSDALPDAIRLRRSLPGPPFRPLHVAARLGPDAIVPAGRLRILGTPRSDDLRPAVVPLLHGSSAPQVAPGFTPAPASGVVTLTPAISATAARGEIAGGALRLRLRLHSAGQVTITAATVYYRTP